MGGGVAIPESQLDTWSHQGSITQSKETYKAIKEALTASGTPYASKEFEVFLQGSYRNDTNVWAESDVDIVICLQDSWRRDLTELAEPEITAYNNWVVSVSYGHADFKQDVLSVLTDRFKGDVTPGNKALTIAPRGNRRKADVLVAIQFRRYLHFNSSADQSFVDGLYFIDGPGQQIVNYPKRHSQNLTAKHQATNSWFKPTVRILKNLRWKLVDDGILAANTAPSYFLEGLLWNVPKSKFNTSYQHCLYNALEWIQNTAVKGNLLCANEQYFLLREGPNECWSPAQCEAFLAAAIELWDHWS